MPFPMKVQPIDSQAYRESVRSDVGSGLSGKPVVKSRFRRLFDLPFPSVLKISSAAEKQPNGAVAVVEGPYGPEFEPSSVCLDKMVQNFIEDSNEKSSAPVKCGRNRCNCFNGNNNDSSDDELDLVFGFSDSNSNSSSFTDLLESLKSLIPCASTLERNLLADTSRIVEKNKGSKRKDDLRKLVADELVALAYNAAICKSKWEKSSSFPAGECEYEYIDVILEEERIVIDIDFRSEFEIARSTGSYKAILQSLPFVFVGTADRLQQIVSILSEAARQSLKKKGMHIPPWRKAEYMKSKWLSPFTRVAADPPAPAPPADAVEETEVIAGAEEVEAEAEKDEDAETDCGELELIFGEGTTSFKPDSGEIKTASLSETKASGDEEKVVANGNVTWQLPAVKPRSFSERGSRVVTGLASLLKENP